MPNDNSSSEDSLIAKAVEMSKSMSVGMMVNTDNPYYTKCDLSIGDNGKLYGGRPFACNVTVDKFDAIKKSHQRAASTYKASKVSSTNDYTAYIYNEGKSMSVCCYYNGESGQ